MSINDIVLTSEMLESLYTNQLVLPSAAIASPVAKPVTYAVLGKNLRRICLMADCPGTAFLPDHHLVFITKLLGACQLSPDDIALVNLATAPVIFDTLNAQLHPQKLLLFGVPSRALGLTATLSPFEQLELSGCAVYAFPSLDEINQDGPVAQGFKKQLWTLLKTMFRI